MSETSESYYYEIALTNRQVLVSFVILLGCVLLAFGAGIWVGRKDQGQALAAELSRPSGGSEEDGSLAALDEFRFPSDQAASEAAGGLRKPDLSRLRSDATSPPPPSPPPPARDQTLAEEVGSTPQRPAAQPPPQTASRPAAQPPPQTVSRPAPPPPAPPPPQQAPPPVASEPAPAEGGFVVQVFATREEAQAQKVQGQLQRAGYTAFISSVLVGSLNNYRVRVGPFASREPAEQAARKITTDFKLETWVTASDPPPPAQ